MKAGAAYVFVRDDLGQWSQQAYIKSSNPGEIDLFGSHLALSGDGDTLAVGAYGEDSSTTGIDSQPDELAQFAGAVYVFVRDDFDTWSQQAYVKASNTGDGDLFGVRVALSQDGDTLAVGAANEGSAATGIDGDQLDNSAPYAGAAYVFVRDELDTWTQQAYIKASNTGSWDQLLQVTLSADGDTLAVGAPGEASSAAGVVDGNQADDSFPSAGALYVFIRDELDVWSQQAYIKASNPSEGASFGLPSLSNDGNMLAVGSPFERGAATGIGGDQLDWIGGPVDDGPGAAYVFVRDGVAWSQLAYVKASNTGAGDSFGYVVLSGDGNTLAVGAEDEASNATGIGGDQANDFAMWAGAVYLY
jgi:hypothetical protein